MEFANIGTLLSGVNIVLIVALLCVYVRNVRKITSLFTWGLVIFAALFLVHNAVSLYFALTMMPLYVMEVQAYVALFTFLQTIAFSILNLITWR